MLNAFRTALAEWIAPHDWQGMIDYQASMKNLEAGYQTLIDQRVAQIISQQDPLEPLLKHFNGVFDEKREQPEDGLSEPDRIAMEMFGYRNYKDQNFHFLMDWIVNTNASAMLKKPLGTSEQIVNGHMYARALLSVSLLLKDKMGRLSNLYEQRQRGDTMFDKHTAVE